MIKQTAAIFLVFCLTTVSTFAQSVGDRLTGQVIKIADGDTYTILTSDKRQIKIRMFGIDTPEKAMPFCNAAKKYLATLIAGKTVTIEIKDIDQYGRFVCFTYSDGQEISRKMIESGYAWHFKKYYQSADFAKLQQAAKTAKRGLWSEPYPVAPWIIRKYWRQGYKTTQIYSDKDLIKQLSTESMK